MSDSELRERALSFAVSFGGAPTDDVLSRARAYYAFLSNSEWKPAESRPVKKPARRK